MGNIRSRNESGKLFFDFYFLGVRCREQTLLSDTAANKKKLKAVMDRIEAEIVLGTFDYAATFPGSRNLQRIVAKQAELAAAPLRVIKDESDRIPSFGGFCEIWWMENEVRWRTATRLYNRGFLDKHLLPHFRDQCVDQISRADVLQFRAKVAKLPGKAPGSFMSPKTVNGIITILKAILDEAALRYGFTSPTAKVERLKVPRKDIEPFTIQEISRLSSLIRPDFRNYLMVRFYTGMRSGEIHGLKWKFVDFERRHILVRETYSGGRTEYTKTDGSQRTIEMNRLVYEALMEQKQAAMAGAEYVFTNSAGGPLDNKNFIDRVWNPALQSAGLTLRRPYQTRHTYATLMLAAGENPEWVARQMGHTTTEMLFKVYSRFIPNLTRRDGAAFEQMVATASGFGVGATGQEGA